MDNKRVDDTQMQLHEQEGQQKEAAVPGIGREQVQALTQLADHMAECAPAGIHWYR